MPSSCRGSGLASRLPKELTEEKGNKPVGPAQGVKPQELKRRIEETLKKHGITPCDSQGGVDRDALTKMKEYGLIRRFTSATLMLQMLFHNISRLILHASLYK
jgi:hypothetical protein